jgi:hypothetical protein
LPDRAKEATALSAIFLSHSSADNQAAGSVRAALERQGHSSVFLDFDPERDIPAGRDRERELYARLSSGHGQV